MDWDVDSHRMSDANNIESGTFKAPARGSPGHYQTCWLYRLQMSSTQNVHFHFQHMQWEPMHWRAIYTNLAQLFFSTPPSCGKLWTFFNMRWLEIGKFSCAYNKMQITCASMKTLYAEESHNSFCIHQGLQKSGNLGDMRLEVHRHTAHLFCISQWFAISF